MEDCFLSISSNSLTSTNGSIVEIDREVASEVGKGVQLL